MSTSDDLELLRKSTTSEIDLVRQVELFYRSGRSKQALVSLLLKIHRESLLAQDAAQEEVVLSVGYRLVGFCSPHLVLFPEDPFPG